VRAILASSSYRLAEQDQAFFEREDARGMRLEVEYLKPEVLLREHGIRDTVVIYGSTRIVELAGRPVTLREARQAAPDDESLAILRWPNESSARAGIMRSRANSDGWLGGMPTTTTFLPSW
jgi:hypothetical protein